MAEIGDFDLDEEALQAGIDLCGRSGARSIEIGFQNEDATSIEDADWYATASLKGARLSAEHKEDPVEAVEALARKVLRGARCRRCGKTIKLGRTSSGCRWTRDGERWKPGCGKPIDRSIRAPLAEK